MLYILFGDSKGDTEKILKVAKRTQSVSWIVPKNSQIGDQVLFYLPKHGFVARGEIGSKPIREEPRIYRGTVEGVTALPIFVPLQYIRENHRAWKWPTYPRTYTIIDGRIESRLEILLHKYRGTQD